MFGISFEHLIIVGIILLVVGPRRLPELGNTMGKAIKNFKDSFNGIEEAAFKRVNEKATEKNDAATAQAATQGATATHSATSAPVTNAPEANV